MVIYENDEYFRTYWMQCAAVRMKRLLIIEPPHTLRKGSSGGLLTILM